MSQGAESRLKYILYSDGRRRPPRRCEQFTDHRKHLFRRHAAGIPMAFLPEDAIVIVLQALPDRNVLYEHRPDRVGAVGVAGSRTVWKKILGRTCTE